METCPRTGFWRRKNGYALIDNYTLLYDVLSDGSTYACQYCRNRLALCQGGYLRRSKRIDELIPWLYLKGVSTGDFGEALQALAGPDAANLSPNVIVKLKAQWEGEYEA